MNNRNSGVKEMIRILDFMREVSGSEEITVRVSDALLEFELYSELYGVRRRTISKALARDFHPDLDLITRIIAGAE